MFLFLIKNTGACTLGVQVAFSTVKSWTGFARAHIEVMRGTPDDSFVYCTKEDPNFFEFGTRPKSGGKTKELEKAVTEIESGKTLREMAESGEHGRAIVLHSRGLSSYRSLRVPLRQPGLAPVVLWLYGSTGTGKTSFGFKLGCNLYGPSSVWMSNTPDLKWFDGYDGQQCAIFDDFRSKGVSFNYLLRITDRYPLLVPIKGGFVNWAPPLILFTTPCPIEDTFSERATHRPEDIKQLLRRVTYSFKLPDDDNILSELLEKSLQAGTQVRDLFPEGLAQGELSAARLVTVQPDDLGATWWPSSASSEGVDSV